MSREEFVRELAVAKIERNDRVFFPKWLARYANTQSFSGGKVPLSEARVIEFCRSLLASGTPAWQRLQAVRAIECYRDLVQRTNEPDLSAVRMKLIELASRKRGTGGLADEPQAVGAIDSTELEVIQEFRKRLRLSAKAMRTEKAYVKWLRQFLGFCGATEADHLKESDIRRFLTKKSVEDRCSPRTLAQGKSALLFLFQQVLGRELEFIDYLKNDKAPRLPVVLTGDEIRRAELQLFDTKRLMFQVMYGAGLRHVECRRLRIKDIEIDDAKIIVRDGKGGKDRVTVSPTSIRQSLIDQIERCRRQHRKDLESGFGYGPLPTIAAKSDFIRLTVRVTRGTSSSAA